MFAIDEAIGFEPLLHARAILTMLAAPFSIDEVIELARRLTELGGGRNSRRRR